MTPFARRGLVDLRRGILLLMLASAASACAARRDTIRDWAQDVTLSPEYGSQDERVVRWTRRPRVGVYGANEAEMREIVWVVGHLADTLAGTEGAPVLVAEANPPSAQVDIEVYPLPSAVLDGFARQRGFPYEPGNHGYFWMFWDAQWRLERAYVLLARDAIAPDSLRHYALEELTQCLGFAGDTPHFADSIFFSRGKSTGRARALSRLDRQLLRFTYTKVAPGADRATFLAAFDAHWSR